MRTFLIRSSFPVLAVAASAALAALSSSSVSQLAVGTTFDVTGDGFARPVRAWLELGERRIPLRISRRATDTQFTATLVGLPAGAHGDCLLRVPAKGSKVAFTLGGISIELPAAASVTPLSARAGDELTIDGEFFGTKRGRVLLGGVRAKVVAWGGTQIRAVVPKDAPAGRVFVDVQNRAGAAAVRPILNVL
jgi:hypothetical protein